MQKAFVYAVAGIAAYLLGSIPFGYLVAKSRGVDIRTVGSKNIGATNVFRTLGKGCGILTFALDMAKGALAASLVPWLAFKLTGDASSATWRLVGGLLAIAGHNWPVFLGFKGGKGVATAAGMLVAVAPAAVGIGFALWGVVFLLSGYVSLASILAALCLGTIVWFKPFFMSPIVSSLISLLAAVVILRHKSNIFRLAHGQELRFSFRSRKSKGNSVE